MVERLFEKRYTKDFAEVYEVPTVRQPYRVLNVFYPSSEGDAFYIGDFEAIDELDALGFIVLLYPYSDLKEREMLLNGLVKWQSWWQKIEL